MDHVLVVLTAETPRNFRRLFTLSLIVYPCCTLDVVVVVVVLFVAISSLVLMLTTLQVRKLLVIALSQLCETDGQCVRTSIVAIAIRFRILYTYTG